MFPKGISLKMKVIAKPELELANYIVTVQHVSHLVTETPPPMKE